jgi:hypothetical protein
LVLVSTDACAPAGDLHRVELLPVIGVESAAQIAGLCAGELGERLGVRLQRSLVVALQHLGEFPGRSNSAATRVTMRSRARRVFSTLISSTAASTSSGVFASASFCSADVARVR